MRTTITILCLFLAATALAEGPDVATAVLEWEPGLFGPAKPHSVPFKPKAPDGTKLPEKVAEDALHARIVFGGGPGLSMTIEPNSDPLRIWIDTDMDRDLTDEKPVNFVRKGSNDQLLETVLVPYADDAKPVPIEIRLYRSNPGPRDRIYLYVLVHRQGAVEIGGRRRPVALIDGSSDARFDHESKDVLYLDVDGDGRIDRHTYSTEVIRPGEPFRVGNEGWVAEIAPRSGSRITFRRADTLPPARPKRWRKIGVPTAGATTSPPSEPLATLVEQAREQIVKNDPQRSATINSIGRVGSREAYEALERWFDHKDSATRGAAVRAVGYLAYRELGARAVAEIAKSSNDPSAAGAALQALHGMGVAGRAAIYKSRLSDGNSSIAGNAARYLAYISDEAAIKLLTDTMRTHSNDYVRYSAYSGMRTRADGPPEALMLAAALDPYPSLQRQGLDDLFVIGHPRTREIALRIAKGSTPNATVLPVLARVLASFADAETTTVLLPVVADPAAASTRNEVIGVVSNVRAPAALAVLVRGLRHREPAVRAVAAQILGGIPRPAHIEALIKRLGSEREPEVIVAIVESLGQLAAEDAIGVLLKMARRRDRGVRGSAVRALARLQTNDPKVRKYFVRLLGASKWEDRVLALDVVAASGDLTLVDKVMDSLRFDEWPVRLAAIEALGQLRVKRAILPLIDRLEREDEPRLADAAAASLFRITGVNLYDQAPLWRRWWAEHGERFVVPKEIPQLPKEEKGGSRAGFYGIPVRSGRVIFVIDQSGSMSAIARGNEVTTVGGKGERAPNRLDVAVGEVTKAVERMNSRDRVNVIFFHTTIHPWRPALQRLKGNRGTLVKHLEDQGPTGGTNLYDGLEMALEDKQVDTIFLLSDGSPGSGKFVATDDILREIRKVNQTRRIAIHCVSIGRDSDLMKRLAAENGGKYVRR